MSEQAAPESAEQVNLFDALHDLGAALPESARPAPGAVANILAGMIRYLDTGSLELPAPDERPSDASVAAVSAENSRIAELESQVNALRQADAVAAAGPSPVAPAAPETPAPAAPSGGEVPADPTLPGGPLSGDSPS
jgi:hypothetical protein